MPGPAELPEGGESGSGGGRGWWGIGPRPHPAELPPDVLVNPALLDEIVKLLNRVHTLETEMTISKFRGVWGGHRPPGPGPVELPPAAAAAQPAAAERRWLPHEIVEIAPEIGPGEINEIRPEIVEGAEIVGPGAWLQQVEQLIDARVEAVATELRAQLAALEERVRRLEQGG